MFHLSFPGVDTWLLWTLAIFAVSLLVFVVFYLGDARSRYREIRRHREATDHGWTWADFGYLVGLTEPDLPPAYKLEESELQRRHYRRPELQTRDEPVNHPARSS